jgi:hypothetical protein
MCSYPERFISGLSIDILYELVNIELEAASILQLNKSSDDILSYTELSLQDLEDLLNANSDPRLLSKSLKL